MLKRVIRNPKSEIRNPTSDIRNPKSEIRNPKSLNSASLAELREKSLRLWHWLFPISILLMLTSKWLFPLVFNSNFIESVPVFNAFLLFIMTRALFPQSLLLALKETKTMLWISVAETLLIMLTSFVLIYPFGMVGVVYGMLIGYLFEKIAMIVYLKKRYRMDWGQYTHTTWYMVYSMVLLLAYGLTF